jgi:hypothetical protein
MLRQVLAVPNYTYLKLKMTGPKGIIPVGSTYKNAYECDVACTKYVEALFESEALAADLEKLSKEIPDPKRHVGSFEPAEEVKLVPLCPNDPDGKVLKVSAALDPKWEAVLVDFLRANADVFAWGPTDMPGIMREVTEHSLDIRAGSKPVKQRLRRFDEEKR